ncbi:MAG: hypothetical protein LBJ94_03555 [Puniceicoccales bacterium]|jgi:tRNA A37 threonylcarbamoyladenosine modification protein TsaB|nr:hypothetical protein [Puniceicoccales bacterium]
MGDFLLIDTSTQLTQCGIVGSDGKIIDVSRGSGDVVEVLPTFVGNICKFGFGDKLGIVYCGGPGSTLGLRCALMSINVWLRFGGGKLKLYRYCSLAMARYLAKNGVIACGGAGKFIVETVDGDSIIADSPHGFENFHFFHTKRLMPSWARAMKIADYDLGQFDGNIFALAHEVAEPNLFEGAGQQFTKWSWERHRRRDV